MRSLVKGPSTLCGGVQLTYVGQAASSAGWCLLQYIMSFKRQHRLSQYFDVTTQAKASSRWFTYTALRNENRV